MADAKDLRKVLVHSDANSPDALADIAVRHREGAGFLQDLVTLAPDPEPTVSRGATWILKAQLEGGQTLSQAETDRLLRGLDDVTAWQAQLHICQSLAHMTIPGDLAPDLDRWLAALLDAPRPFLRAWAMDALCRLHGASPETTALLRRMESDKAASVLARVRNLGRKLGQE